MIGKKVMFVWSNCFKNGVVKEEYENLYKIKSGHKVYLIKKNNVSEL